MERLEPPGKEGKEERGRTRFWFWRRQFRAHWQMGRGALIRPRSNLFSGLAHSIFGPLESVRIRPNPTVYRIRPNPEPIWATASTLHPKSPQIVQNRPKSPKIVPICPNFWSLWIRLRSGHLPESARICPNPTLHRIRPNPESATQVLFGRRHCVNGRRHVLMRVDTCSGVATCAQTRGGNAQVRRLPNIHFRARAHASLL